MATSWQVNMTEMITGGLDASLLPEVALAKDEDNAHLFVMRLDEFGIVCEVICICKVHQKVFICSLSMLFIIKFLICNCSTFIYIYLYIVCISFIILYISVCEAVDSWVFL